MPSLRGPMSSLRGPVSSANAAATVRELQQQVHRMQGTSVSQPLPTLPALRSLVQLRTGASYAVDSPLLAMALMAGPSSAGSWCGVVGVPDFGIEAAAALGVDPDRTILVPEPGDEWLNVAAAMIDVLTVVVVQPPGADVPGRRAGGSAGGSAGGGAGGGAGVVGPHQAARLGSRLRQREAALIALGDWPRCDARLRIRQTRWSGIGQGHGHLSGRRVRVTSGRVGSPTAEAELWLPDAEARVRIVDPDGPNEAPVDGFESRPRLRAVEAS